MRLGLAAAAFGVAILAGCGKSNSVPAGDSTTAPVLPPTANPGGPYTGMVGTPVSFTGAASTDPQGEALTYAWNFGDGTTGTGETTTHTYGQVAGVTTSTYTVGLTVTDTYGESGQATTTATIQGTAPLSDAGLTGTISTGSQAIVGAHVYLFAANTTGYGGAGIAASSSNASISLLSAAETGTSDTVGAYVVSNASGNFSMTGDYTCTAGQQVYIYALGGTVGGTTNSSAGLLTAIGPCPSSTGPAVVAWVNEVSTVAAAYSLAGFATDAVHVSSSSTALGKAGIANAFANAANLVKLSTGVALAATPSGSGTAPQAQINGIANILSTCVNPTNQVTGSCAALFEAALSGGLTGTAATDTATAAIYIAHNPGANVADLYDLPVAAQIYTPGLGREPNDLTVSIVYQGGGLADPLGIAIDGAGDVWTANSTGNSVTEITSAGAFLSGTTGYTTSALSAPMSIAIDPSGDVWTANSTGDSITELVPTGTAGSVQPESYSGAGLQSSVGIAIDGAGDPWVQNTGNSSVVKVSGTGSVLSTFNGYAPDGDNTIAIDGSGNAWIAANGNFIEKISNSGTLLSGSGFTSASVSGPSGIAIDSAGDAWIVNKTGNSVTELSNSGTAITGPGGIIGGGLATPFAIAMDGAGDAFVLNQPKNNLGVAVVEISNSGVVVSGANAFVGGSMTNPFGIAVDGSGDVWITSSGSNALTEFIGVGAPVVTPLSVGVKNNAVASRP